MDGPLISLEMLQDRTTRRLRKIHVVGGGTLGGGCVDDLCRYRVPEVIVHDPDTVESRNRYNQIVYKRDIGHRKPDVLARHAWRIDPTGTRIVKRFRRVTASTKLSGFVLLMVDTMRDRKLIMRNCIEGNDAISLMIEARMGVFAGRIYAIDPCNPNHVKKWKEHSQYDDDPDVLLGCKAEFPAPSTAKIIVGEVMWRLLNWLQLEQGSDLPYYNYIGFNQLAAKKEDQNEREVW